MKFKTVKLWVIRIILMFFIVSWMNTIYGFSAADGVESQSLSDKITVRVIKIIKSDFNSLSAKEQKEYFENVSFYVRKAGHFGEYGILAGLWFLLLITFKQLIKRLTGTYGITIFIAFIYAASDEYHQGFVDGRNPQIFDVFVDVAGAAASALILLCITYLILRRQKNVERLR